MPAVAYTCLIITGTAVQDERHEPLVGEQFLHQQHNDNNDGSGHL